MRERERGWERQRERVCERERGRGRERGGGEKFLIVASTRHWF